MKKILFLNILFIASMAYSQQRKQRNEADYKTLISEGTHTVAYITEVAEKHFEKTGTGKGSGYKQFKRWQYIAERSMDGNTGKVLSPEERYKRIVKYNKRQNKERAARKTISGEWEIMGPVSAENTTASHTPGMGRISAIDIDVNDANHIIVGGQTGGVWKTTDAGLNWTPLSDNMPSMDVFSLAMDANNSSTYYWGSTDGVIFKSTNGGSTWNLHATVGSRPINRIAIDPSNSNKLYCSSSSGIYKSTNGGSSWSLIHPDAGVFGGLDIEFKPGDPNTVYATGSEFFKSIDGGNTFTKAVLDQGEANWTQINEIGNVNWSIAGNAQSNLAGPKTGNGFFSMTAYQDETTKIVTPSLDISGGNPTLSFSYALFANFDVDNLKVYYKTSSGGSWIELAHYFDFSVDPNIPWEDVTLALPNPSTDYYIAIEGIATDTGGSAGIGVDDVSITTDSGIVFSDGFENASNTFSDVNDKMMAVSMDDPNVIYVLGASIEGGGGFTALHKSTDSGVTFTMLNHAGNNYLGYHSNPDIITNGDGGQAPSHMDIAANPKNADEVYIAGINPWRSLDGGVTFEHTAEWFYKDRSIRPKGYCHADIDIMMYNNDTNPDLFIGSDGGLFRAEEPASTVLNPDFYTDLSNGLTIRQIYKFGVSQTNPVIITTGSQDNGSSILGQDGIWRHWLGADGMEGFIDKDNPDRIYGTFQNGFLMKSVDGGLTRENIAVQPPNGGGSNSWVIPYEQDPIAQDVIYAAYKHIVRSEDFGANWSIISQNFNSNIQNFKIAPTDNSKMYLSVKNEFWYTNDGGATNWIQSSLNLTEPFSSVREIAVHPTNPNKIAIAVNDSNKVYTSIDGGVNFSPLYNTGLPDFTPSSIVWDGNSEDGLYIGMNFGIFYTDNTLSSSWISFSNGLPNVRVNELEINYADNKLYTATYGRGVWRSNRYDSSILSTNVEEVFSELSVFPNPAKSKINITWNNLDSNSKITLYNSLGQILYYNKDIDLSTQLTIPTVGFNSGLYFVKINNSKGEIIKKVLINN